MFEWYVVMCVSKNEHEKNMCSKEIGLRAQNILTILNLLINKIRGAFMTT